MARNAIRRLSREEYDADQKTLAALQDLSDYTPVNPDYAMERINALAAALATAEQNERRAINLADSTRDIKAAAVMELHSALLGAKTQVLAQYGPDSDAVQSVGLKKKSEHRRPARRTPADS